MVQIGKFNQLKVLKLRDIGAFLDGGDDGEILLPLRYLPPSCETDQLLNVFICYDSEDRLIATTETPKASVGDFAQLRVVSTTPVGAFLDWGLPKDLFLPFAEQTHRIREGDFALVYLYLDNTQRIAASMRIERHLDKNPEAYQKNQEVNLLIAGKTDLGFKAIINGRHLGMLYNNEIFQELKIGQKLRGHIKGIRPEDGKIDLILQKTGHHAGADIAPQILEALKKNGGFLAVTDKTSAEKIYELFGVSKKKFKIALGGLYKKRLITITDEGLRLNPPKESP